MDMALTHTLNAFALPLLVIAVIVVTAMAVRGCLLLAGRTHRPSDARGVEDSTLLAAVSPTLLTDRPRHTERLPLSPPSEGAIT